MTAITVDARKTRVATLIAPPSKSDAHRALMIAEMLGAPLDVPAEWPNDVLVMARGLAGIQRAEPEIDCEDAGAPFRMLLARAALEAGRHTRLKGTERLGARPHAALMETLRRAGAQIDVEDGPHLSVTVRGAAMLGTPELRVKAAESSQFASSLLLSAALLFLRQKRAWSVVLDGELASRGYLELTVRWLLQSGFRVGWNSNTLTVYGYSKVDHLPANPSDWSALGYLLLMAWKTGSSVDGVDVSSEHPDRKVVAVLESLGLSVKVDANRRATVTGVPVRGLTTNARAAPDLMPTLAALACVLPQPSTLLDVNILRTKESDRVEGIVAQCAGVGARVVLAGGAITIHPPERATTSFRCSSAGDHRRVMATVTAAVLLGNVVHVEGAECVRKSFPGFFDEVAKLTSPV